MPRDNRPVLVESGKPQLCYHNPSEVPTEIGMEQVTLVEAENAGAVACSPCFVWQDSVQYNFGYIDTVSIT